MPIISKKVRWRAVWPTTSMSVVRKHFWIEVTRGPGGVSWPRKYALNGCMPAVVSSTVGSSEGGTSDADGTTTWSRAAK